MGVVVRSALAAAVVVVAALGGCGDDDSAGDVRADQARTVALDAGLDGDVADFLALAAGAVDATFTVRYDGGDGGSVTVASDPPDLRLDVAVGGTTTESRFVIDGIATVCRPDGDGSSCERVDSLVEPPGVFTAEALESTTEALAERREQFDFDVVTKPLLGVEATCLVTRRLAGVDDPSVGDGGELCVSPDGVLLLADQSGERLEALEYSAVVPDGVIALPDGG